MYFNQDKYIYFPDNQDFDTCPGFADSDLIRVSDTRMYYLEAEESETILVYYHGNAGSACDRAYVKERLKNQGLSLLFVEYAGYSGDHRKPSLDLIMQDTKNAQEFIRSRGYDQILLTGTSLGSAVAAYHQTHQHPYKMILFASFDALSEVGKKNYPLIPVGLLLRDEYDTAQWMREYTGEILILHGEEDKMIPPQLAERLYESIPSQTKKFVTIPHATHNTLLDQPEVWDHVIDYITSGKSS